MSVAMVDESESAELDRIIQRSNQGDDEARKRILELAYQRLETLSRSMLRQFPGVRRWEQTDDIWQNAAVKLWQSLERVQIRDAHHFYCLAALHIRRQLIELVRHYYGPLGLGTNQRSVEKQDTGDARASDQDQTALQHDTFEASQLAVWTEFHEAIDQLPQQEREVFDLLWYQDLTQAEAAKLLAISERTIKRRWQAARLSLHNKLQTHLPSKA